MTGRGLPRYLITVRASAVARSSGSYNSTAHAPKRIQFVKVAGACSGSSLSPARKLLRLSFAGSSFIKPYLVYRLPSLRTTQPGKVESFLWFTSFLTKLSAVIHTAEFRLGATNLAGFEFQDKTLIGCQAASLTWQAGCQPAVNLFGRLAACQPSQPSWLTSGFTF